MTNPRQVPGFATPAAGFDAPFEMLQACHERVESMLGLLQKLVDYLVEHPRDAQAKQAAQDVMRYFDLAAPLHHQDEERHVFPAILRQGDVDLLAIVARLQQDHLAMEVAWQALRRVLEEVVASPSTQQQALSPAGIECVSRFLGLYKHHIADENLVIFPAAQQQLTASELTNMSEDMMQRRGVRQK